MASTHGSKEVVCCNECVHRSSLSRKHMEINCDSQRTIFLANNPAYHSKMKHIDVQYHFVRDMMENNKLLLVESRHVGKNNIFFDQVCECCEVLLV
jgi:hypothetical protein